MSGRQVQRLKNGMQRPVTYPVTEDGAIIADCLSEKVARELAAVPDLLDALHWVLPAEAECDRCKRCGEPCVGHAAIRKTEIAP